MARGMAALLLAALLGPFAPVGSAQPADAEVRALVALASPFADELTVELRATGPTALVLPDGTPVELDEGAPHRYAVELPRPSTTFALARVADVLPGGIDAIDVDVPGGWTSAHSPNLLAMGEGMRVESRVSGEGRLRVARVAELRAEDVAFLDRGLAYLAAQHGHAARDVLLVVAPAAALADGFAVNASVALPADAPVDEMARLLARAHQRYRVVEVPPASAAWFREGEERASAQHALMAAGLRTAAEVDDTFTRARAVAEPDARLPQASADSTLARQKGLVVVRALDAELRNATRGHASLADLLAGLGADRERRDSASIEEAARAIGGERMGAFFERYVYGEEWPATPGVRDAADVFVLSLRLREPAVPAGEQPVAEYAVVNRGTQPGEIDLVLHVDDAPARTFRVALAVGERAEGAVAFTAPATGPHVVALGPHNASLHVLSPAQLELSRASHVPAAPLAGETFTLLVYVRNAGETSGRARIEVHEGGVLVQRATEFIVDGGATHAVTLPMRADVGGAHAFEVRLLGDGLNETLAHAIDVAPGETRDVPAAPLLLAILVALALRRR